VTTTLARTDPLGETPALKIARRLAAAPGPLRVWNGYNASGTLIAFAGGREGHVKLVVDGRSDLWGGRYIERLVTTQSVGPGWEATLNAFAPDALVLPSDTPLVAYLLEARRWRIALQDGSYALVLPPGSPL
jgi:hypothetical protein